MMGTRKFLSGKGVFPPGGVNLRAYLCGVLMYASSQPLGFLARTKNRRFPNRKPIVSHPVFSVWKLGSQTMRLWTLHPRFLDCRGLVALWREALLAQAVLSGNTRWYLHHPQLLRFRNTAAPLSSIASYLHAVLVESVRRGYHFNASKIPLADTAELIVTSQGQLDYEWTHLKAKLRVRDPYLLSTMEPIARPDPHPLFRIVPGLVEGWEILQPLRRQPAAGLKRGG